MPRVTRINVFPVKGLRGVSVESAVVTETGFELDRTWSVIDESGERYAAHNIHQKHGIWNADAHGVHMAALLLSQHFRG